MKTLELTLIATATVLMTLSNFAHADKITCSAPGLNFEVSPLLAHGLEQPTIERKATDILPEYFQMSCTRCAQSTNTDNTSERHSFTGMADVRGSIGPEYFDLFLSNNLADGKADSARLGMLTGEFSASHHIWTLTYLPEGGPGASSWIPLECRCSL
jgi:hypothetical protein